MWTSFFNAIQYLTVDVLMVPMDWLAKLELTNWWAANTLNWIFIIICSIAFVYWLKQLKIFKANNEDEQDTTAHSFLK
ncbi:uracil phosphoribosyltransferase [Myroides ceti]|uniref:Uracil phosphoribosyltransferase n=1 Tax=Paenimyroides ceti TaxID=395087 RepID=A0ABT8CZQ7_9FLAO|nr:uracil phosphoribosyltransferase [Paenimyroides ceti]MDN3708547.1 uracil phosphoribosyltransferase [Paenimyroides ceti]